MASYNRVALVGNLVRDPEIRYLADGKAVVKFTIAINRRKRNGQEDVDFLNIVAWDRRAESCNTYLRKGSCVLVEGALRSRSYDKDGERRTAIEVVATDVQFLTPKPGGGDEDAPDGDDESGEIPF